MKTNFDSPLVLSHSGSMVNAHGPIEWDPDEESGTFTITIMQNGVSATKTQTVQQGTSQWQMTMTAANGGEFNDGHATGSGSVVVTLDGGGAETYGWTKPIALQD